jgi:histidyl-tRNA synthetase
MPILTDTCLLQISFDLSLARGLDYYTGIIYEAVVEASAPPGFTANASATDGTSVAPTKPKAAPKPQVDEDGEPEMDESTVGVGSIAAGGRYDNLVQLFTAASAGDSKAGKKAPGLPCVGVSIGLDRVFALTWPKWVARGGRSKETVAFVMAAGDGLLVERVALVRELREAGIKVCPFSVRVTDSCAHEPPNSSPTFSSKRSQS